MNFTAEQLNDARKGGYSDDEIWNYLGEQDQGFSGAKEAGYSLDEVADYFGSIPKPEVGTSVGQKLQTATEELEAGIGRAGTAFTQAAVGSVKMISDAFGANNQVSKKIAGVEDYLDKFVTAQAKQDKQEISRLFQEAEDKGLGAKVLAGLQAVAVSPETLGPEVAGYMLPSLAAGVLTGGASVPVQIGAQAALGGIQAAGTIKGNIYTSVRDYAREQGLDEDKADKLATKAQAYGGKNLDQILIGAGIGAAAASTGAERIITKLLTKGGKEVTKKSIGEFIKNGFKAGGVEAITEGTQEAQEQIASNLALQREGADVSLFKNVPQVATMGAAAGGLMGGAVGGIEILSADQREERDINRDADKEARNLLVPEADSATQAAVNDLNQRENAVQSLQEELDTLEPTDPKAQQLRLRISEEQKKTSDLKSQLSLPITTAEQQQIELAKQIARKPAELGAMPTPAAQTAEATYGGETGVYDVFGGVRRKPAPTVKEGLTVPPVTPAVEAAPIATMESDVERERKGIQNKIKSTLESNKPFVFRGDGFKMMITKSSKEGSKYQATLADERGPYADFQFDSLDKIDEDQSEIISYIIQKDRPDVPDDAPFVEYGNRTFQYELRGRPAGPKTVPSGYISTEKGGRYGIASFDRILTDKEIKDYELKPIGYRNEATKVTTPATTTPVSETITEPAAIVEQKPVAPAEAQDIESGAPPLSTDNLYFENNLAQRAWRIAAGFKYDKDRGDWFHPSYPELSRGNAEQEITDTNPPTQAQVRSVLNQLKQKYTPKPTEVVPEEAVTFEKGDMVRVPNRVPVYKKGEVVGGKTVMVGGSVTRVMPDGKVEVRLQQGGYATLPPAEIEMRKKAPAPATTPAPAEVVTPAAPAPAVTETQDVATIANKLITGKVERLYDEASRTSGGRGIAAGSAGARQQIEAASLVDMRKSIQSGASLQDAASTAKASAREMIKNHNAKRKGDVNWQINEDFADAQIDRTVLDISYVQAGKVDIGAKGYVVSKETTTPTTPSPTAFEGIAVGNRVKTKTTPQSYVVEEVLPQSAREAELGEQYYRIKNERTGEVQTVEASDITAIKKQPKRKGEAGGVIIPSRQDWLDFAENIYEAGMSFADWSKKMLAKFGEAVRSALQQIWDQVGGFTLVGGGMLPQARERGAVKFGRGEEPKKPAEAKPEMARYKGKAQVASIKGIGAEKDTPKGINKKTEAIIRDRVFDAAIVNDNQTKKAWNLIQKIEDKNPDAGKNAQAINELTRETMQDVEADEVVKQTIGAVKLRNELYAYAIKLAGDGDPKMLNHLLNTRLSIGSGSIVEGDAGRLLQAMKSLKSWIVRATEAEQTGFFTIAAQQFFDTKAPTDDQVQKIKDIFNKVKEVKIDQEKELMDELEEVGKASGIDLPAAVEKQLENTPGLDPMVIAMTAMQRLYGGTITTQYEPMSKRAQGRFEGVKKIIQGGITNYRNKLVSKAATGLETGFWKTLSSTENKPGPLGELDSAQNRALGNIVKQTLVKMGLEGTPPDTKMSIYEQVASILGEQPLSQDKIKMADEKIRGGIQAKRESELENASEDQEAAINLKYDGMIIAWDDAMSRSLDMPVSDTMLRRMILNELKEADTSIQDIAKLMEEEPVIGASRQDRVINSIIEKVTGITFEGQLTRDYTNLKTYLSSLLENMVLARQQKNQAAKDTAKLKRDAGGDPEKQAQAQIDKLAKVQADPTIFGEKRVDPVRNVVRDALALQLNIGFTPEQSAKIKAGWKGAFVADPNKKGIPTSFMLELQRLGVSESAANTLADIVWRQIEINALSRQMDATTKAVEAGPIGGIVQAILDTPLANQQDPEWRKKVIVDYLKNAGVKPSQAENIAKLFDISLRKRFAKAQEEAAIKAAKSIEGGLNTNSRRALEKFLKAIRAQVLDPGKDIAKAFAEEMGWKGFTSEQIVRLNALDAIVNDNEKTDAETAVALEQIQQIIDKVSAPPQVKEVMASFYIGNALMRFPTFAVQAFDPLAMATFNTAIESFRNITNPQQFIQTWVNYGRAVANLARETAFSFKNDVLRSGRMIDYLNNEDRKIKRLWDEAEKKWKRGDIRGAMKDGIVGYTTWTFRTLKALDDGAYSLLTSTTLPQYVEAALKNAKIPREKRRGVMRQVLEAREMDIKRMVAEGVSKNDAVVYANERMQAAITKELSGLNINAQEVINSAINDSLARIGKTRFAEDILTGKTEEIKDLGTISAPFLRWYESVSKAVSGKGSESQKIFYRILLGFPLIPARIFNIAAGYTPLTIYRHAMQAWKGKYQLTYGTALQRRQRLAEQLAGTMVLLPLLALRSNSTDEEDEKEKGFGVYITGQGPSKLKDKTLHAKWNDRHDPFSLEFRMGGKTKFSIDAKAAGPLSVMIYLLGAMDDWETNRKLDGLKTSKDDWKEAQDNASIFTSLYELAGYAVLTTARRGPTTGVMQGLVDFRRFPDDPIAAIGADVSFSAMPAVPILGTGIAKNLSDFLSQPIDNTTKEGAILSNIPIVGPIAGKPALNSYGQKIGELRVSEKLKKSFGVPFTLVVSDSEEDNKLTSLTLKFGDGPTPLRREDVENELRSAISDEEWYLAAKTFGDRNRSYVLKNYNRYEKMKPVGFSKLMSALGKASKANAIAAVKKARRNNP